HADSCDTRRSPSSARAPRRHVAARGRALPPTAASLARRGPTLSWVSALPGTRRFDARARRARGRTPRVMLGIGVEKSTDHSLILRVVLPRLAFEELHAALAQRDRDFHPLVAEHEICRRRKEVTNDLQPSEWLIRVSDFDAHRSPYPFASNRRQRSGRCCHGT